ncbi:citrate/2-methylcitrate synthase [Seongchinamella unica]|uniref:Citrate synthase n=1 Tax=Seongchinamella unica TaxID=2547392 RepID=A0A4R5LVR2_9GAMM|nr:citrate/2-methylcitrate synthase [Seongchinamella unica]TDG15457.1 citrate/2-methylcitrate synthase [Seongchinamella unica]
MSDTQSVFSYDLAGVVVGETAISDVQGDSGLLSYRGIDINDLIGVPFLHVAWLVVFGEWPDEQEKSRLKSFMCRHARLTHSEQDLLGQVPRDLHPMLMLQGMIPLLQMPEEDTLGKGLDAEQGLFIAAKISGLIAAHHRLGQNKVILHPIAGKLRHENFLTMFHGKAPSPDQVRMLDAAQILQMEHSFNAGTFAGRVCASTLAPIQSAISASIGTLFGRLHGGADQAALEMAMEIGSPDKADAYVRECLANKVKIMGMGHREYRTVDPRAKILKPMAVELCQDEDSRNLLATLIAVEEACQREFGERGKEIWANVEFYKGAVFHSLGIPSHYFTAMFAMARVYGYIAHFLEFRQENRLIRPRAAYVGKPPVAADQSAA